MLVLVGGFGIVCIAAGVIGARWVRSPAQEAADRAAPAPTQLTATVVRGVLTATVIVRGTVGASGQLSLLPRSAFGASSLVVTALPLRAGATIHAGQVLAEVSGRPIFVLVGRLPPYRDLRPGDRGPDVAQLQVALRAVGHRPGADPRGVLGPGTLAALRALYAAHGYAVAGAPSASYLPADEVIYVPREPASVVALSASVGEPVTAPIATVSYGSLEVVASLDQSDAAFVTRGLRADLASEVLGDSAKGRVVAVGLTTPSQASTDSTGRQAPTDASGQLQATIAPDHPLPLAWFGQDVEVRLRSARTPTPVLIVPTSAITERADGVAVISVVRAGATRSVVVTPGAEADGQVEVRPARGATLVAGERVVIGQR